MHLDHEFGKRLPDYVIQNITEEHFWNTKIMEVREEYMEVRKK